MIDKDGFRKLKTQIRNGKYVHVFSDIGDMPSWESQFILIKFPDGHIEEVLVGRREMEVIEPQFGCDSTYLLEVGFFFYHGVPLDVNLEHVMVKFPE